MSTLEEQLNSPQRLEDKVRGAMLRWFGHVQRGIMDIFDKGCCIWSYHAGAKKKIYACSKTDMQSAGCWGQGGRLSAVTTSKGSSCRKRS